MKLYQKIASCLSAVENCQGSGNEEWSLKHAGEAKRLTKEYMPSGSGIDCGTQIDLDRSTGERLVFRTDYHHMTEGMYDGWTHHVVAVRPSLQFGIVIEIGGRNRNDIKEYLYQVFYDALMEEV